MDSHQLMRLEVFTAPPELPLTVAWRLMQDRRIRHLPVVAGERLVGIVSDRDVLLRATRGEQGPVVPDVTVGEVMTMAPLAVAEDVPIAELAHTMLEARIDALPVLGSNNRLLGLVTSSDLLRVLTLLPRTEGGQRLSFVIRRATDLQAQA